jgi:integrase
MTTKRQAKVLTEVQLRAWLAAGKPIARSDGDGLTFTLSTAGLAAWILRYRVGGRRRELTIGRYPDLSLQSARRAAARERLRVGDGVDVAAEKRRARHASVAGWTVRQAVKDYTDKVLATRKASTQKLWGGYLRAWVLPRLGAMLAVDVEPADVRAMLFAAAARGPGAVRTLQAAARAVFEHARGLMIRDDNPAIGIKRKAVVKVKPARKGASLAGEELTRFLRAVPNDVQGDTLRVHLITGVRPGELCGAPWSELDLDAGTWRIEGERTKKGEGYTIRLPPQAVEALRRIKAGTHKSTFVLPATRGKDDRPIPYQTYRAWLWRVLDRAEISRKAIKPHDLRRTMRSGLTMLGVRYEVAERAINHKLPELAEIYDRNDYAEERAAALVRWADHLDALRTRANVTPIRRKRA